MRFRPFCDNLLVLSSYVLSQEVTTQGWTTAESCTISCHDVETKLNELDHRVSKLDESNKDLSQANEELEDRVNYLQTKVEGKIKAHASCQQHYDEGARNDGIYSIQPTIDYAPVDVYCTFNTHEHMGITSIEHTHQHNHTITATPGTSNGCADPGCFKDNLTYRLNADQIEALIGLSGECEQSILLNCTSNAITDFAWWLGRDGHVNKYWHGTGKTIDYEGCQCFETDSCDSTYGYLTKCNCDSLDEGNVDRGTITSMTQLPIKQLAFGDSGRRYSWVYYKIENFICKGKGGMYPSEVIINDFSFKTAMAPDAVIEKDNDLLFPDIVFDRTQGALQGGIFHAPINGYYDFNVQLLLQQTTSDHGSHYRFSMQAIHTNAKGDMTTVDQLHDNSLGSSTEGFKTINFKLELKFEEGDTLQFHVDYSLSSYKSMQGCNTGKKSHACSWFSGRWIKELE